MQSTVLSSLLPSLMLQCHFKNHITIATIVLFRFFSFNNFLSAAWMSERRTKTNPHTLRRPLWWKVNDTRSVMLDVMSHDPVVWMSLAVYSSWWFSVEKTAISCKCCTASLHQPDPVGGLTVHKMCVFTRDKLTLWELSNLHSHLVIIFYSFNVGGMHDVGVVIVVYFLTPPPFNYNEYDTIVDLLTFSNHLW